MKVSVYGCAVICAVIGLALGSVAFGNMAVKDEEPAIMVSPQMVVLAKISTVTVHSNIDESSVVPGSVTLNGIPPLDVWSDDCGHLAARFGVEDLNLSPGEAALVLQGVFAGENGDTFSATETIRVK